MDETNDSLYDAKLQNQFDPEWMLAVKHAMDKFANDDFKMEDNFRNAILATVAGHNAYSRTHQRFTPSCSPITRTDIGDVAVALSHGHASPLRVDLHIGGQMVYSQILAPHKTEWICNGLPIILIWLAFHDANLFFFEPDTLEPVSADASIVSICFPNNVRYGIMSGPVQVYNGDDYSLYEQGMFGKNVKDKVMRECVFPRPPLLQGRAAPAPPAQGLRPCTPTSMTEARGARGAQAPVVI